MGLTLLPMGAPAEEIDSACKKGDIRITLLVLDGDSYDGKENITVVFVAFCGGVGFIGLSVKYNRAYIGSYLGRGIDGSGDCAYYDGRRCTDWYSVCYPWIPADDKEYFLVSAK